MHVTAGFPVKSTWLRVMNKGNFATWPGLTYSNAAKYCPRAVEAIKGHMVQSSQGVRSTKKKTHPSRGIRKEPAKATLEKIWKGGLPHPTPVVQLQKSDLLRYPPPTSKGGQGKERVTTSNGVSQQQPLTISKTPK